MKKSILFVLAMVLIEMIAIAQPTGADLTVVMTGFESEKGQVMIGLYDSSSGWLKRTYKGELSQITNKEATVVFSDIPAGTYAVSIIHDENGNGKLDTGYFGIPSEPYASSMGAVGRFGPPKWEDAKFTLDGNEREIKIKL